MLHYTYLKLCVFSAFHTFSAFNILLGFSAISQATTSCNRLPSLPSFLQQAKIKGLSFFPLSSSPFICQVSLSLSLSLPFLLLLLLWSDWVWHTHSLSFSTVQFFVGGFPFPPFPDNARAAIKKIYNGVFFFSFSDLQLSEIIKKPSQRGIRGQWLSFKFFFVKKERKIKQFFPGGFDKFPGSFPLPPH